MTKAALKVQKRRARTRYKLKQVSGGKLRLSIHRSPRHIYAQIIDDAKGVTVVSASTVQEAVKKGIKSTGNIEAAKKVGQEISKAAKAKNITEVVFDRGSFRHHGRVKALADAAREAGLKF